jgi:ech hydrogenase subunit A
MDGSLLLLLLTLVPALFGIVCYLIPGYSAKKYVIILCALVLTVASLLVLYGGAFSLAVESVSLAGANISISSIILVLDYLLLLTFLGYGIKDKEYKAVALAILQMIPLTYFDFFMTKATSAGANTFVIDQLSIVMCLIVSIIGSLILIYSIGYMKGDKRVSPFFLIMMVFLGDMNALVFANDLVWMFFFWEVTTLCSFLLIRHYHDDISIKASDRALWINLLGGVSIICGIVLIEYGYHTTYLSDLIKMASTGGLLSFLPMGLVALPFALLALGAFTKSALMPFNSWLTGAMVAPTPVSALLHSSTMVNAGVYLLIRMAPMVQGTYVSTVIAVIGGFSFMFCALLALSQTDSKRILAYSTISYLGLIAMCTGINTGLALTAAVALLVFHAVSKCLLFLCVGKVAHDTNSRDIESMEGLVARMPLVGYIMVIGLISLMAPPFGVFVGKWLAFQSVSTFSQISLSLVDIFFIIFGSIFSVFYYSRWAGKMLATKPFEETKREHHDWYMELPLIALLLGVFVSVALTTLFFDKLISLPAIYGTQPSQLVLGSISLQSTIGGFSPLGFLIIFLIIIFVPMVAIRVPKSALTHTYACGTGEEPELGGGFFQSVIGESAILRYIDWIGILLLIGLFAAVLI